MKKILIAVFLFVVLSYMMPVAYAEGSDSDSGIKVSYKVVLHGDDRVVDGRKDDGDLFFSSGVIDNGLLLAQAGVAAGVVSDNAPDIVVPEGGDLSLDIDAGKDVMGVYGSIEPIDNIEGVWGVKSAGASYEAVRFQFKDNDGDGIYSGKLVAPVYEDNLGGSYNMSIVALEKGGDKKTLSFVVKVIPRGVVYDLASRSKISPLANALVFLYYYDDKSGEFKLWEGRKYGQQNPYETDDKGRYYFIVPRGKYYMEFVAEGYPVQKTRIVNMANGGYLAESVQMGNIVGDRVLVWLAVAGVLALVLIHRFLIVDRARA